MGAVKKHFHKILAGFLCVCLLLSYNPAFGAIDAAFADETSESVEGSMPSGAPSRAPLDKMTEDALNSSDASTSWDADKGAHPSTEIKASTFDSTLQSAHRDSFSATVEQLRSGSYDGTDISYIWYEVTGGMPYTDNGDPYRATWKVYDNDQYSDAINRWIARNPSKAITLKHPDQNNGVANYHLNIQELAKATESGKYILQNDHKYTFVGTFTDSFDGSDPIVERVTVYTVPFGLVKFKKDVIEGKEGTDLEGTEIEGMISQTPRPELIGGKVPSSNPIKEAMEEEAAKNTMDPEDPSDDGNYVVQDVLQIGTNPSKIPGVEGMDIPPYDENGFILRLPLDPDYAYNDPNNPGGYKEGDTVKVLWSGDDTGRIEVIEAPLVPDGKGGLQVEIPYPYSGDEDGDGVDDTGWPPLPGYFAIQYDTNKLPGGSSGSDVGYFSITAKAEGNGIVTPAGKKYWRINTGVETGSALDNAMYAFAPMGFGEKAYKLTRLLLESDGYGSYNLLDPSMLSFVGGALSPLNTTLTLDNAKGMFVPNSEWTLTAVFELDTMSGDDARGMHSVSVSAKKKDGSEGSAFGGVMISYYDESRTFVTKPNQNGNVKPAASVSADVINTSKATISMVPASPKDGKFYEPTGIRMKVGNRDFEVQAFEQPFVVPATTEDVEIQVIFEEFTETGLGGTVTYTGKASVADDSSELGSVMKDENGSLVSVSEVTVNFGKNSTSIPTILFQGVDEDKYLSAVDVYVGDRKAVEHLNVNVAGKQTYSLILPNYHDNIEVVGYFTDKNAATIHLSVEVRTEGVVSTEGGNYSTLAWTLPSSGMVRSGQRYPLLITPADGYVLYSVEAASDGEVTDLTNSVKGGVLSYTPYDGRVEATDPLEITLTITFETAPLGGGLGDNNGKLSKVNMYTADKSFKDSEDLSYMFSPEDGRFFINGAGASLSRVSELSVDNYEAKYGVVNGQTSLFATVNYGGTYPINLVGSKIGTGNSAKQYGIQKLLVVSYYYGTDDNGERVKKGLSWNLYNTNMPVFQLTNVTTHTDVIAYFAPVGDGTGGTVEDNGFEDPKDYCTVTTSSTPQGKVTPYGSVKVLKGSNFPVNFTVSDPEYRLTSATVKANGSSKSITSAVTGAAAGASSAKYIVENIAADTEVTAAYAQKSEDEMTRYKVSADIQVKDGDETKPLPSGSMPCSIRVSNGVGTSVSLKNGEALGVPLLEGSDVDFSLSTRTTYRLNELGFTWDDPAVKAYRVTKTLESGVVVSGICLTTDETDLIGRQEYRSGDPLYKMDSEAASTVSSKNWMVNNLVCAVALVPTFEKVSNADTPDYGDYWALTTKVGSGFGQILVNDAEANGCITKVKKQPNGLIDEPIKVDFVPADGYRIKSLEVTASTGNVIEDFWSKVQNFLTWWNVESTEQHLKDEAMASGSITLLRMRTNYDIVVEYEPIPGADTPATQLPNHVATNVLYDPDKGTVVPNSGLVVNRDAEQQFVVTPNGMVVDDDGNEAFYSVVAVRVSVGDDVPEEVSPFDEDSDLVKWDPDFPNVFVVDYSKLGWPTDQPDAAVTIEVVFSDDPTTEKPDGSDPDTVPGTPTGDQVKNVTVNVVTEGVASTDDNGIGGLVSPRGTFILIPPKDARSTSTTSSAYKQRVDVIPASDYELSQIEVSLDNDDIDGWYNAKEMYERALREGKGYFEVIADKPGIEVITVYFKLKPLSERSYSISMEAHIPDADRFIQPNGVITLENTKSQSYSIDPDLGYQVKSITDMAVDENGRDVELPIDADGKQGANWTRGADDEQAVNEVTINPIRVNGKAVNRHVVIEFEAKEGVDHGLVKSDKVNLHVKAYGPGSEYLTFDPAGDMTGVFKGTDTKPMSYTYNFSLSQDGLDAGYRIYRVQANGETVFGSPSNTTDMRPTGSFTFTTENMTRETNNLYVYVKKDPNVGSQGPGTGDDGPNNPGDDPNKDPDKDPGNNPGGIKYVTVDYGCGNGGSIVDKNPAARLSSSGLDTTGGQLSGSLQVDPEEPFVLLITPNEGNVIDKIIMDNCYIIEPLWMMPEDGRTAKIALESTMMVLDDTKSARVLATFKKGDANTFKPWDATQDTGHTYTVDGKLIVEVAPADGVEALVEVENGSAKAADMLDVSNPVAPFLPKTAKKSASSADSARYEVTYDTVSKLGEENTVSIVVGPLIKWNEDDNSKSTLYTIDNVTGLQDGFTVTEKPLPNATTVSSSEADKPAYYSYYEIVGTIDEATARNIMEGDSADDVATLAASDPVPVVHIGLRNLSFDEGVYPDYMAVSPDNRPDGTVVLRAQVTAGEGTIAPTTTTVGTSWYDGNLAGPWTVAKGTPVSFKVEAADGFVLTGLSYNSVSALGNGAYDAESETLTFAATASTTVYAEFSEEGSADAMRTVTIEVEGGHGTTSPEPGTHQVEKGQPYSITFLPDTGYVPYRIWVDGQASFVAPTLSGWMLPAWWDDQTFKVEYALRGTTPSGLNYLVQTGQNVADQVGTSLVRTGDNPWLPVVVLLLLIAGGAAFGGMRMMRASETAGRAMKYSVTRREVPRREEREASEKREVVESEERTDE